MVAEYMCFVLKQVHIMSLKGCFPIESSEGRWRVAVGEHQVWKAVTCEGLPAFINGREGGDSRLPLSKVSIDVHHCC